MVLLFVGMGCFLPGYLLSYTAHIEKIKAGSMTMTKG